MKPIDEFLLNKFAQGLEASSIMCASFKSLSIGEQRMYLKDLIHLIIQSKAVDNDVDDAIAFSGLKPTFTPCVMLKKGVKELYKIVELPENELEKAFLLMLNLFKISYLRRFNEEMNNPNKWWYKDLSQNSL